ncbi:MAG TPA: hypothetical protein VMU81_21470 [Acetobacteraceae bacterium]|nr:hypothetical protein [Acetobacteraceae bacterium]
MGWIPRRATLTIEVLSQLVAGAPASFSVPVIPRRTSPGIASGERVRVASSADPAGTATANVRQRAESRDYNDTDAILRMDESVFPLPQDWVRLH